MKFVRQYDAMDCGPACVGMIASHYGRKYSLAFLRPLCHMTRQGVTVSGIRQALEKIGIRSASFKMTADQLCDDCPMPAILYWEQRHFVVIERVSKNRNSFVICDPAFGRHKISKSELQLKWTDNGVGIVIAAEPDKEFKSMHTDNPKYSFSEFTTKYVKPYRNQLIQGLLAMLAATLMGLIMPFLTQAVVDHGIGGHDKSLIFDLLLAQLALFAGQWIMEVAGSWVTLYMSTRISINIIGDYLVKLLDLPIAFFDTKSTGDYQQRLADHSRLQTFITSSTVATLFAILSVPFYLAVIAVFSTTVSVVFLTFTLLSILWTLHFFRKRKSLDYEQFALGSQNNTKVYELISGITDVKINGLGNYKIDEWKELQQRQYDLNCRSLRLSQLQSAGFNVITQLRNIIITTIMALAVIDGAMTWA